MTDDTKDTTFEFKGPSEEFLQKWKAKTAEARVLLTQFRLPPDGVTLDEKARNLYFVQKQTELNTLARKLLDAYGQEVMMKYGYYHLIIGSTPKEMPPYWDLKGDNSIEEYLQQSIKNTKAP